MKTGVGVPCGLSAPCPMASVRRFRHMRIGLAQLHFQVGDLAGNRDRIIATYRELVAGGADLVVFPELALCGSPPNDHWRERRFADNVESALLEVAAATGSVPMFVGALDRNTDPRGRPFFNAAAFCYDGVVQGFARKVVLPSPRDAIDEGRFFQADDRSTTFMIRGHRVGVTIGEDLWGEAFPVDPLVELARSGVDLLINLSASSETVTSLADRHQAMTQAARRLRVPVVYVDAVRGSGVFLHEACAHEVLPTETEATRIIELDLVSASRSLPQDDVE